MSFNFMVLCLRRKVFVEQLQVKTKVVPQQVSFLSNVSNYKQNIQYTKLWNLLSNLVIRNVLIRNKLVLSNHFQWPIVNLLHKYYEHLALRNNFRVTKKFLIIDQVWLYNSLAFWAEFFLMVFWKFLNFFLKLSDLYINFA